MNRKEKLKQLFKHNTVLKLLSIGIAFIIWLVVVNVSDPEITESISTDVSVLYEDELTGKNKTYTLDTNIVKISYKVRSSYRRQVHPSDFDAYIDMRDLSITGAVPVYVDISSNAKRYISNDTVSPIVIHVDTEDMIEKSFNVETSVTGSPADGKLLGSAVLSSDSITLFGPSSELNSIGSVVIDIDADGAYANISGTGSPAFYDASGSQIELSDKVLMKNSIDYSVPVYTKKNLSVNVSSSGVPAEGYKLDSVTAAPSYVVIYGTEEAVSKYSSISIPGSVIDVSGANKNVTVSMNISQYIPQDVYLEGTGETTIVAVISRHDAADDGTEGTETSAAYDESQPSETESSKAGDETESITDPAQSGHRQNTQSTQSTQNGESAPAETGSETEQHTAETKPKESSGDISELPAEEINDASLHGTEAEKPDN